MALSSRQLDVGRIADPHTDKRFRRKGPTGLGES